MRDPASLLKRAAGPTNQHERTSAMDIVTKVGAVIQLTFQPAKGHSSYIRQLLCNSSVYDTTDREQRDFRTVSDFKCKITYCRSCTFCCQVATKEKFKAHYCKIKRVIKVCERCFLCRSIEFCPECH